MQRIQRMSRQWTMLLGAAVAAVLFASVPATAQANLPPNWVFARNYAGWNIVGQTANTYTFNGGACNYTPYNLSGISPSFFVFSGTNGASTVYFPVAIIDANSSLSEVVTPTSTTQNNSSCGFAATTINQHTSFVLTSGTAGLQEAIISQQQGPPNFNVILDKYWYQSVAALPTTPSTQTAASIIASVTGNANVGIVDTTTLPWTYYQWNGSKYVAAPLKPSQGGTGQAWGSSSGIPQVNSGTFSLYNTPCNSPSNALIWSGAAFGCNTISSSSSSSAAGSQYAIQYNQSSGTFGGASITGAVCGNGTASAPGGCSVPQLGCGLNGWNGIFYAYCYSGATFADQIAACSTAALASTNGTDPICDLTGLGGTNLQQTTTTLTLGDPSNALAIEYILPLNCNWQWTNTGGTANLITIENRVTVVGASVGGGGVSCRLSLASSASINNFVQTLQNVGTVYGRVSGFGVFNQNGATVNGYLVNVQGTADETVWDHIGAFTTNGNAWYISGISSAGQFDHLQGYASNGSFTINNYAGGGIPLTIGSGGTNGVKISNSTFNAPGTGHPNIYINSGANGTLFDNVYGEGNCQADTTTAMVYIASGANGVTFNGGAFFPFCSSSTTSKYTFEAHGGSLTIIGTEQGNYGTCTSTPQCGALWVDDVLNNNLVAGASTTAGGVVPAPYVQSTLPMYIPKVYSQYLYSTFNSGSQNGDLHYDQVPYNNSSSGQISHCSGLITVAVTGTYNCQYNYLQTSGSTVNTGTLNAISSVVQNNSSGLLSNVRAYYGKIGNGSATGQSITNGFVFYADTPNNTSGTLNGSFTNYGAVSIASQLGGYDIYAPNAGDKNLLAAPVQTNGITPNTLYSAGGTPIPACGASNKGQQVVVQDANNPVSMSQYTSGGTITVPVFCSYNSSTSVYMWMYP